MKVKALKTFWDKHTGEKHVKGDVFEVTQERCEEILAKGPYVEKVAAPKKKAKEAAKAEEK